jgi:hypothetical protein
VLNPGERHASPTSCNARPALSLDVSGRPDNAPLGTLLWPVRSRRRGRCLVELSGEVGSCFTITLGICGVLLLQVDTLVSTFVGSPPSQKQGYKEMA